MLWQHDPNEMIGGWYEVEEDATGLRAKGDINLATQRGREYYALAKAGMSDQFSIIYDIPSGGAHYDKSGVRDLTEMRLFSIDPVTFAMNDATFTVTVKASATSGAATVVGNVKGPIGPRDEAWDGAKAEGQIWAAAYDDDSGEVNKTLASKYFMLRSGDGTKKGDYSYPFWFVDGSPHICVGAVKAIAAALSGSRGANAPDALKGRIATLYNRINAKYPDDPQLTPPWQAESEKGRQMPPKDTPATTRQGKTFQTHYAEEMCCDLLEDWQDVVLCAFTNAVYDALTIGDQPEADVSDALDGLKVAVMQWVEQGVQYGLSDYLEERSDTYDGGALYRMQQGSGGYGSYGYMSRQTPMHKAMTASDATTGGFTADHVDKLRGAATKAKDAVDRHVGTLQDAAEEVKGLVSSASKAAKAGRTLSASNEQALTDHADALDAAAKSLSKAMTRHMGTVNSVADDLATVLQGSEAAYGTDAGTPQTGQEGKNTRRAPSGKQTRAPHTASSHEADTPGEDDIAHALDEMKKLRTA
jgi:HK97 family phage prohead protease